MWSYKLGKILGIEVRIHVLFILLLLLLMLTESIQNGVAAGLLAATFVICVFSFVFLHELGHSVVALFYRIPVRSITLWPFGGIACMDSIPRHPQQELLIALAGPVVNLVLALLLSPLALVFSLLSSHQFFVYLVLANMILAVFNLLPAFPMDGGRIYRAWQARRMGYLAATRKATQLGTYMAIGMAVAGAMSGNFLLVIIAFLVIMGGREELALLEAQDVSRTVDDAPRPFFFFYVHPNQQYGYNDNLDSTAQWLRKFCERYRNS